MTTGAPVSYVSNRVPHDYEDQLPTALGYQHCANAHATAQRRVAFRIPVNQGGARVNLGLPRRSRRAKCLDTRSMSLLDGIHKDLEGSELSDLEKARVETEDDARFLMSDAMLQGQDASSQRLDLECDGASLFTLPFKEAIKTIA